jgi:tRNA(fMet)-specific endonuclease VapC
MGVVVDTSVFVNIERTARRLDAFITELGETNLLIAAITASELLLGVHGARPESRRAQRDALVEEVLKTLTVAPFDLAIAREHARLWSHLARQGQMIGPNDLLIAATAVYHGYAVLTDNVREFERIPELEVRSPRW